MIDIGDRKPWYNSPLVKEIIKNPEKTVAKEIKAYNTVPDGIQFITMNMPGGALLTNYKADTIKPFVRVLRRASLSNSEIRVPFELSQVPTKAATLVIEGLDHDKPECNANLCIRINDKFIAHQKPNQFKKDKWSKLKFRIKPGILKKDTNTLHVYNTTKEKANELYTEIAGAEMANPFWGWFMISDIKLLLPDSDSSD